MGLLKYTSVTNAIRSCNYTQEQGIRSRCTVQLEQKTSIIACRVVLNAYSEVLDACVDANW